MNKQDKQALFDALDALPFHEVKVLQSALILGFSLQEDAIYKKIRQALRSDIVIDEGIFKEAVLNIATSRSG